MKPPIELLQDKLNELISARKHSIDAFEVGKLDEETHLLHIKNLTSAIEEYKYAIRVINTYA